MTSRRRAAEAPPDALRLYTETELFKHVTPDTQPNPPVFARDFPRLVYHVWLVCQEFLECGCPRLQEVGGGQRRGSPPSRGSVNAVSDSR